MRNTLIAVFLSLLFIHANAQEELLSANTLDMKKLRGVNAVVRKDELTVEIKNTSKMEIYHHRIVTVFNKKGNSAVNADMYYNELKKIKNIDAEVYDASGNEIKSYNENDFIDRSAYDGFSLYNDARIKEFPYKPLSYPYTVAFTSKLKTENTALIPSYYFISQNDVKVEQATYTVNYDREDLSILFKEKNFDSYTIYKEENDEGIKFKAEDLPIVKRESLSPHYSTYLPHIRTVSNNFYLGDYAAQNIEKWEDLGAWYCQNLLPGRDELPQQTIAEVKALTKNVDDPLEKAKLIYEYVQENMRYVSVQIGIGGLQPISAKEVDENKYGDCKGLANYTYALLKSVGIPSNLVIVEAGDEKVNLEDDFPNLSQGNHMILAIPNGENYCWIDCTSKNKPFGFLGTFTDDRKVFVMKENGGEIVKTPAYLNKENYQKTIAKLEFDQEGIVKVSGEILTEGSQYDNRNYIERLTPDELQKRDFKFWSRINNVEIKNHSFTHQKDSLKFKEKFELSGTHFGKQSTDRIIFPLNVLNRISYVPLRYRNRKLPLEISRGFFDEDEITIKIPEGYSVEVLPKNIEVETEFGKYTRKVSSENNFIKLEKSLLIKAGIYEKEKYDDYREFRKKISSAESINASIIKQ